MELNLSKFEKYIFEQTREEVIFSYDKEVTNARNSKATIEIKRKKVAFRERENRKERRMEGGMKVERKGRNGWSA